MHSLRIHVSFKGSDPRVSRIDFGERKSFRGKGLSHSGASFIWSAAIISLSKLVIGKVIWRDFCLDCDSLYEAMRRPPLWYRELFDGFAICLKENGLVYLNKVRTEVIIGHKIVSNIDHLLSLWEPLFKEKVPQNGTLLPGDSPFLQSIVELFYQEAIKSLNSDIHFSPRLYAQHVKSVSEHPCFVRLAGKNKNIYPKVEEKLSFRDRLGCDFDLYQYLSNYNSNLKVACSPANIGLMTILELLKSDGIAIDYDFSFVHSIDIVDRIVTSQFNEDFELVVLGIGQIAYILGTAQTDFEVFLELPSLSMGLLEATQSEFRSQPKMREVLFLDDERSNSSFFFSDLVNSGILQMNSISTDYVEPLETSKRISAPNSNSCSIMYFPYLALNTVFNNCQQMKIGQNSDTTSTFLLAHKSIIVYQQRCIALNLLIRNAWWRLMYDPNLLRTMVRLVVHKPGFLQFLSKSSGVLPY